MAHMAKNFNIELYFFTPKDFSPQDKTVRAVFIDGNNQTEMTIPLPKIVYDITSLFYQKKIRTLFKDHCYFFQYGWGASKQTIFDVLTKDGRFKEFLIETHTIESFEHFLSLLKQYHNDVVLKPDVGSLGKGVVRITADENEYVITFQDKKIFFKSVAELQNYYEKNFTQRLYALQPYIFSRTKYGNPFDIRVHARRGAEGKFKLCPYPRLGRDPEGILSNISAGGYTMPINKFLQQEYGDDWQMIYDKLIYLGNNIPELIQSFCNKTIFAMGIDVGIQRRGDSYELKVFEINTYNPGIGGLPIEAAFITLEYLQYLGKNPTKELLMY